MCNRITLLTNKELAAVVESVLGRMKGRPLIERFEFAGRDEQRAQARPGDLVSAFTINGDTALISALTWGFKSPTNARLIYNTRIESALGGSPLWAEPIRHGRCVLPAASFFEAHKTETTLSKRTGRPIKRQYEFTNADGAPLLLASVQGNGQLSIVTTEPNAAVSPIHERMPLVLEPEEVRIWLEGGCSSLLNRANVRLNSRPEDQDDPKGQLSLFD